MRSRVPSSTSNQMVMQMYTVRIREGGVFYEMVVAAESWDEAELRAWEMNGEVTGRLDSKGDRLEEEDDGEFY
jgi:hypothetical protein